MKAEAVRGPVSPSKWISTILFVVVVYLMYSATFLSDYLMNDEWAFIGRPLDIYDLARMVRFNFYSLGRGLFGAYQ